MEKIVTSRPIDRTAARVTSQGPKGYESGKNLTAVCSAIPPETRPIPDSSMDKIGKYIGAAHGRLTVVGLSAKTYRWGGARWVCRCVCGYYVIRSTKAIRREGQAPDMCDRCKQVEYLKRTSTFAQLGYNPDTEGGL